MKFQQLFYASFFLSHVVTCSAVVAPGDSIVGGQEVTPHSIPFQVSLRVNNSHFCGGSLISPRHVLTTVTCSNWTALEEVQVVAGDHNLMKLEGTEQNRTVAKITVHEEYGKPKKHQNDIAIWELSEPFLINESVGVVSLPKQDQASTGTCTVSGWGAMEAGGNYSMTLMKAEIPVVTDLACRLEYPSIPTSIADSMLCAGEVGKNSCQGDTGGPLVCYGPEGEGYQAGIVSWGRQCGAIFSPGVFTELSYFVDWIRKTTNSSSMTSRVECPNGWIDAQDQNLGCIIFVGDAVSSWSDAESICENEYSGFLVEALSTEEARYLFEIAELIQLYTSDDSWWIGLTGSVDDWTWYHSNVKADQSLYSDYFQPSRDGKSCVVMTVEGRELQWLDLPCSTLPYQETQLGLVCQCKGETCQSPTPSTTPGVQCQGEWIDADGLGCVKFLSDDTEVNRHHAQSLCKHYGGFLLELKTMEDIEFISTLAGITETFTNVSSWWIGLESVEGNWTWSHSNVSLDSDVTDWGVGEPSSERCVELARSQARSGEFSWRTADCNTTSPSLAPVCQQCRPGETGCSTDHFPLGCHLDSLGKQCYILVNTAMTWEAAKQHCREQDGDLASVLTEEENSFIGNVLLSNSEVWLGGQWRNSTEGGAWTWSDGSPWDWDSWADGQPGQNSESVCALMHHTDYHWASFNCNQKLKSICKY